MGDVVLSYVDRVAQRPRQTWNWCCTWCGQLIVKGEAYNEQRGIAEGHYYTVRDHKECHEARCRDKWGYDAPIYESPRGMTQDEYDELHHPSIPAHPMKEEDRHAEQ